MTEVAVSELSSGTAEISGRRQMTVSPEPTRSSVGGRRLVLAACVRLQSPVLAAGRCSRGQWPGRWRTPTNKADSRPDRPLIPPLFSTIPVYTEGSRREARGTSEPAAIGEEQRRKTCNFSPDGGHQRRLEAIEEWFEPLDACNPELPP